MTLKPEENQTLQNHWQVQTLKTQIIRWCRWRIKRPEKRKDWKQQKHWKKSSKQFKTALIYIHKNFASKMLITTRQPARSALDPGPRPGNIITSWQKNSEVIQYQILKYVLQFNWQHTALHQRQLEGISSGRSNTSRELMDSVMGMKRDLFSLTIISIILWSLGRSQEGWAHRKKMKNTENIVFAVKTQADSNISLWETRWFCQVIRQRGTRDALPEGCQYCEKKTAKTVAGTTAGADWCPLPRTPPAETHPSQRSTDDSLFWPFIVIVTWQQSDISHLKQFVQNI